MKKFTISCLVVVIIGCGVYAYQSRLAALTSKMGNFLRSSWARLYPQRASTVSTNPAPTSQIAAEPIEDKESTIPETKQEQENRALQAVNVTKQGVNDKDFKHILHTGEQLREIDVDLTFSLLPKFIAGAFYIERRGSVEQQMTIKNFIQEYRTTLIQHAQTNFENILNDPNFRKGLKAVVAAAVSGSTANIIFNMIQLSASRQFTPGLLKNMGFMITPSDLFFRIGIGSAEAGLGQLVALMRGKIEPNVIDSIVSKLIVSTAQGITYTPLSATLMLFSNEVVEVIQNIVEEHGGAVGIMQKLDLNDIIIGTSKQQITASQGNVQQLSQFGFHVLKQLPAEWKAIALSVGKKALMSAIIGGAFYLLGFGFCGEVEIAATYIELAMGLGTSMSYAAVRGGIQGFIEYIMEGTGRAGFLAKTGTAGLIRGVQRLISGQTTWALTEGVASAAYEITVTGAQQVIQAVTETVIHQLGGAKGAVDILLSETKKGVEKQVEKRLEQAKEQFKKAKASEPVKQVGGWLSGITGKVRGWLPTFDIEFGEDAFENALPGH